jgi:hypothetical protein
MSEMPRPRIPQRYVWLPWLGGALLLLGWAWATGWPVYGLKPEIDQGRLNTALPTLDGSVIVQQSFTPARDGLREIELVLVRHGETEGAERGRVFLQLLNATGETVAEAEWPTAPIRHNDSRRFRFSPQPGGQTYTLVISGNADNNVSVWAYDQDVLAEGKLTMIGAESSAQELRFTTHYQLTLPEALAFLGQTLWQHGPFFLLTLLFLFLPGLCLEYSFSWLTHHAPRTTSIDLPTRLGIALALGISFWAILWLWWSLVGFRWAGWSLWLLLGVLSCGFAVSSFGFRVSGFKFQGFKGTRPPFTIHNLLLLFILLLGFAGRILAIRDQAFPPWVDSSRHALITVVMAEQGQFLSDYTPFLDVVRAPYHYGFHTISASLSLMTGREVDALLLWLGPLLNGLVPLAVYAAATLFTRRRSVALVAAFLTALPFFFPAYYATWGRFTQLTGMLILPVLVGVSGFGFRVSSWKFQVSSFRFQGERVWLMGVLAAGLFLVHFRVFLLYVPFVLVLLLMHLPSLIRHLRTTHHAPRLTRYFLPLAATSILALLLITPRLLRLAQDTNLEGAISRSPEGYNDFPVAYFTTGWETPFAYAALLCLPVILLAWWRGRRWARPALNLALWVGLLFLLLSGRDLGLPETWLINTNSMAITLFLPVALVLALVGERVVRGLMRPHWLLQFIGYGVLGGWFAAATLFGLERQSNILNEQTILARPADRAGIAWVEANLPDEAVIAVNSWAWLGQTWAGSDGGAWLVQMTGLRTTTPPADYVYNRLLSMQVRSWNQQMTEREDWASADAAAWLRSQGINHLFVGQKGGFLDPSTLLRNPELTLLYNEDGVFVFAVNP